jgi:hypothetical protein
MVFAISAAGALLRDGLSWLGYHAYTDKGCMVLIYDRQNLVLFGAQLFPIMTIRSFLYFGLKYFYVFKDAGILYNKLQPDILFLDIQMPSG